MKKNILSIAVISSVVMLSGCASDQPVPNKIVKNVQVEQHVVYQKQSMSKEEIVKEKASNVFNSLPEWIKNSKEYVKDGITAVGSVKVSKNDDLADRIKDARDEGRLELAKRALVQISSTIKKARERASVNLDSNVKKALQENVKILLKDVLVSGAHQIDSYLDKNGNFYVLMKIDNRLLNTKTKSMLKDVKVQLLKNEYNDNVRKEISKNVDSMINNLEF